ncbi:peptidoglycan hydrolase-like protein with peptidoglycan-binding domain [Streptosporangium album]|uniref:Peptidoglycan hydrolase-like protein with peptidoglycan-binding domain n=1 Tax=Streptosporangium album TaxID=47479 RepID=A0A7W7RTL1_9ACTN|nr:peptidoglycan-binding protein [Streptosporangium album]MBB4937968.1 peptidoglycan hydrolase-like protein with peptidoglycan-binding domain [Streptosporangium album]
MRRGLALSGVALLAVVAAGAATALLTGGGTGVAAPAKAQVAATAAITRQDLVDTKTVTGALTYSGRRPLTTGASGTVTWVPDDGAVVRRGRSLLKVDRKPVTLMYGSLPLYRPLRWGVSDGPDVEQLESNLKALGYGADLTVDDHFSNATHLAVREWQDDRGLTETGQVDDTQVVFLPSAVRVTEVKAVVGGRTAPGRQALAVSDLDRLVHLDLDSSDQMLAKKGAKVTVELPGGEKAAGKITEVGTVAKTYGERTVIDVEIMLTKDPKTKLDQAPVEVELVSERRENVLAVPVEALLALREGGFGVEIVEGSGTRLAPVKVGAFGSGMVEITGDGLTEGMKVGVPSE